MVVRPAPSNLVISRPVEQLAQRGGWLHRRVPEAKIAAVAFITFAVLSETSYSSARAALYALLALLLICAARLPPGIFFRRALLVAPVLLLAAALPWISRALGERGVTGADPRLILAKGLLAITLLTLLAATTRFADLLGGLERLRAPAVIQLLAGLMYRYVPMLLEEWERMELARRSRTPGEPRRRPVRLIGRQIANLFLRAWQRADRVQAAMESRAFSGRWPRSGSPRWTAPDFAFLAVCAVAAAAIRFSEVLLNGA